MEMVKAALLGLLYFCIFTPIGWAMRVLGFDPMHRKLDKNTKTYWVARKSTHPISLQRQI
jgi:hypothetical protein